jgi:hypothetical protein
VFLAYFTLGLSRGQTMATLQKLSDTAIGCAFRWIVIANSGRS